MWRCCAQKHPASKPYPVVGLTQNAHGLRPPRHARCARKQHQRSSVFASWDRTDQGRGTPRHDDFQGRLDAALRFNPAEDVFAERIRGQNGATPSSVPWEQNTWHHQRHQEQQQQQQQQQQQPGRLAYAFGTGLLGRGISASQSPRPGFVDQDFQEGDLRRLQSEFWRQKHELQLHRREHQEQGGQGDGLEDGEASRQEPASSSQQGAGGSFSFEGAGDGVRQQWFQEVDLSREQGGPLQAQGSQSGQQYHGLNTDSEGHNDNIISPVAFYEAGAPSSSFEDDKPDALASLSSDRHQGTSQSSLEHGSSDCLRAAEQVNGAHVQHSSAESGVVNGFGTSGHFLSAAAAAKASESAQAAEAAGEGEAGKTEYRLRAVPELGPVETGSHVPQVNSSVVDWALEQQELGEAASQPSLQLGPGDAGEGDWGPRLVESEEERVEQPAASATVADVGIQDATRQGVAPAEGDYGLSLSSAEDSGVPLSSDEAEAEAGSQAVLAGAEQQLVSDTSSAEEQAAQAEQETQMMAKQLAFAQKLMYPDEPEAAEPEAVEPEWADSDSAATAMEVAENAKDEVGHPMGHQAAGVLTAVWEQEQEQEQVQVQVPELEQEGHLMDQQEAGVALSAAWEQEQELSGEAQELEAQELSDYSDELGPNGAALMQDQQDQFHQEHLPQEQFLQDQFHIGQFTQEGQSHQGGQAHQEVQALQERHHPIQQDPFPIGLVDATDCGADTMIFEFGPSLDAELSDFESDQEKELVLAARAAGPVTSMDMSRTKSTSRGRMAAGSINTISTGSLEDGSSVEDGSIISSGSSSNVRGSRAGLEYFDSRAGVGDFESLRGESRFSIPSAAANEGIGGAGAESEPNFVMVNGALAEEGEPGGQQEAEEEFWDAEDTGAEELFLEEEEKSSLSKLEQEEEGEEEEEVQLEHQQRQLRLVTGVASMPHPLKASRGGEDAYLSEGNWVGVADGVSMWAEQGVNSGLYSRELLWNCVDVVRSSWELLGVCPHPTAVIEEAHSRTDLRGSCTVCLAVLEGQTLKVANIGDTGFVLVRFGDAVVRSDRMAHALNDPFQIGCSFGDDPSCAMVYEELVQPGDVILLATDGLFDNLFLADIVMELRTAALEGKDPELVAKRLAILAQKAGEAEAGTTPYANLARAAGQEYEGGRREDVTIVVAYVEDPDED